MRIKNKPPLGVEPQYSWDTRRMNDLGEAIKRHIERYLPVPQEWISEFNVLAYKDEHREIHHRWKNHGTD